jgi:hypothetical protein
MLQKLVNFFLYAIKLTCEFLQGSSCNYCFPISWVTGCVAVGCHVPIQSVSINNLSKIISLTCSPLLTCHIVGDLKSSPLLTCHIVGDVVSKSYLGKLS